MSTLAAVQVTIELTQINCGECGGTYAINERYRQQKYNHGDSWNCPYCKVSWGYEKGELTRTKEALEAEKRRHQETLSRANAAEQARIVAERATARLKKRVSAGTCPCCKRTFSQLSKHMANKHPDFGAA